MVKGSLSVFFSMIMVAVMGLIFVMSECIRVYELQSFAQQYTDMAVESAFSEYNPYLWTNYKILAIDLGYGSENIGPGIMAQKTMDYCKYNSSVETGVNYSRLNVEDCSVNTYSLLTDNKGNGVIALGVKATEEGLVAQIIDGIQDHVDSVNNIEKIPVEEKISKGKKSLSEAKDAVRKAKAEAAEDNNPETNPDSYPEPEEVEDNPLEAFDVLKEAFSCGILSTVTDVGKVSNEAVDIEKMPSHRQLHTGTMETKASDKVIDKVLFINYLLTNYSYYGNDLKHDGLSYEVEYLLSGKETDTQCLAYVVEQILLVREAANYATIMQNPAMVAQVTAMAETLAGFTMNPAIVEVVKYAVIGAWAYAEAILDLRLILSGGKVSPIKNLDQWTSDVWHLSSVGNVNFKAKDCRYGTGYKEYLMAFLAIRSNNTLSMRALDVMENALNSTEDYAYTKVDNMLWSAKIELSYSGSEMFLSLFSKNEASISGDYLFKKNKFMSY